MIQFPLFIAYFSTVVGIGVLIWLFISFQKSSSKEKIRRSFNLQLFLVKLPPVFKNEGDKLEIIREKIAIMEKVYSALNIIKDSWWHDFLYGRPAVALEIAIPHVGEELSFYIGIPHKFSASIEKIIQSVFSEAVVEPVKDYNIFNPEGAEAAVEVILEKNMALPIRSYRFQESDPLKEITNAFSKLAEKGEGAALQLVVRPASKRYSKLIGNLVTRIHQEGSIAKGLSGESIAAVLRKIVSGEEKKKEGVVEKLKTLTFQEQELVKQVETKGFKPLFETNIRLVASANNSERAQSILSMLKAAFAQFANPGLNNFSFRDYTGGNLRQFLYDFSFRNFSSRRQIILSSEELTSIYHLPNVVTETPKIKMVKAREALPPADLPKEGLLLGYNTFRGQSQEIKITTDDRRRHLYVVGQTGTGKTAFLKELIKQDIEAGEGLCFIDPHGDAIEDILSFIPKNRIQDVVYFNPGDVEHPLGLNFLEYDLAHPEQKTFIVNELFDIFKKIWRDIPEAFGPMFEQYFRNATLLVMEDPDSGNTLYEIGRVMTDKNFRDYKISQSKNLVVNTFWREVAEKAGGEASLQNMVPYISSKFDVFLANEFMRPIILQEKSAFNFREIMDNQKILLINLSKGRLGELNSYLLGLIMVGKVLMAALSRGVDVSENERRDFYLYIDEFQNVTTKSIATILSEARKYRLDLIISHQFIGQLEDEIKKSVFGNIGSMIVFRVGSEDGEFLEKQFVPTFTTSDLINLDNYTCYVKLLMKGKTSMPFSMKTYPPKAGHPEIGNLVKESSWKNYGHLKADIEKEIRLKLERI